MTLAVDEKVVQLFARQRRLFFGIFLRVIVEYLEKLGPLRELVVKVHKLVEAQRFVAVRVVLAEALFDVQRG